eukprot:6063142-Prymnesium_polylepis.1
MIERPLAAGEELAEDRQQAEEVELSQALFAAKRVRYSGSAGPRQWANCAHSSRQRSGMHSGRWAEAAHLFLLNLAPNWKMLSSARHRAGRFDSPHNNTTHR